MHETLTQQSDKKENQNARDTNATIRQKGKPKCERHYRNNQTERETQIHGILTQQSDKKENQSGRDTNATIRHQGKLKCFGH